MDERMWWDDDYVAPQLVVPDTLIPGDPDGACLGNGTHEGYECCCDECDYLALCCENDKE